MPMMTAKDLLKIIIFQRFPATKKPLITIRPHLIVDSIKLFRNYEVFDGSTGPAQNMPHRAAVPT